MLVICPSLFNAFSFLHPQMSFIAPHSPPDHPPLKSLWSLQLLLLQLICPYLNLPHCLWLQTPASHPVPTPFIPVCQAYFQWPIVYRSYQVWATVKRRLCRMLLLTISLRNSRGELRGDSLGDVALRFPPPTPGILGGSSSRCMCSLNVRMQESISTLSSLDDIPAALDSSPL